MPRITNTLTQPQKDALRTLAEREFRELPAQAALLIRTELERLGLLAPAARTGRDGSHVDAGSAEGVSDARR